MEEAKVIDMEAVLAQIKVDLHPKMARKYNNTQENYHKNRLRAIMYFHRFRPTGCVKNEAATLAAELVWTDGFKKSYRSKIIISWTKAYIQDHSLSYQQQGLHAKRISLFNCF
jgi:hypothetical protein